MTSFRSAALIAASLLFHILLLGGLGSRVFRPESREASTATPLIYLQIEPRPLMSGERPRRHPASSTGPTPIRPHHALRPIGPNIEEKPEAVFPPAAQVLAPAELSPVAPDDLAGRIARSLRTRGAGCLDPSPLSQEERRACDERLAARAATAATIRGTGDSERDARFARQGARALAAFDERREVRAAERPACPKDGPVADCGVEISVDIFSTREGFFPNQRRDQ